MKSPVGQIICTALLVTIGCGHAGTVETGSAAMAKAAAANRTKDYATSQLKAQG